MNSLHSVNDLQSIIAAALKNVPVDYEPRELYAPIDYSFSIGGKRMRPMLTLMACDMFSGNPVEALHAAIAIEVFHNFTLVHDDIMDNAPLRRGKETVYKKWNNNIAILVGDTMFALACAELGKSKMEQLPAMLENFTTTARQVCEGQQMDMNYESRPEVSICDYIDMITLKTGALFGCSLKLGAIAGNAADEDAQHLFDFGSNLGISFQIKDDLLDVFGNEQTFGKKTGGDIIENKKTYLYLRAFEVADKTTRRELYTLFSGKCVDNDEKVKKVTEIYSQLHIKEMAEDALSRFFNDSLLSLDAVDLPDERKELLRSFSQGIMFREK